MKLLILILLSFLVFTCEQAKPRLFLIGDSTMADKPDLKYPERGWGQILPQFFDSTLFIENHAKNGRSSRSFIYESRWDSVYKKLNTGDYVVIQFGHNDGVETKIGRHSTPEEFRYNLIKLVKETQIKKAHPLLCSPIVRRNFISGELVETHGIYPNIVREVAEELNIPFIDMHKKSQQIISKLGEENSLALFLQIPPNIFKNAPNGKIDNTHFSEFGARTMASIFVEELKNQKSGLSIFLKMNN